MTIYTLYRRSYGPSNVIGYFKSRKHADECRNGADWIAIGEIETDTIKNKKFRMMRAGIVSLKTGEPRDVPDWDHPSFDPVPEGFAMPPSVLQVPRAGWSFLESLCVMVKSSVSLEHAIKQAMLVRCDILEDKSSNTMVPSPKGGFYWFVGRDGKKTLAVVGPGREAPGGRWSAQVISSSISYGASFPRECPPNPDMLPVGPIDSPEVILALEEQGWNTVCN